MYYPGHQDYDTGVRFRGPSLGSAKWSKRFMIACVVMYFLQWLGIILSGQPRTDIVAEHLALVPKEVLHHFKIWQLFTHAFLHSTSEGFPFHIFFNLLAFYFFAPAVELHWGPGRFARFLILSILVPGVVCMFFYYSPNVGVIGASGVVYAVLTAYAFTWPRHVVYLFFLIPMPAFAVIMMFLALETYYTLSQIANGLTGVANIAHLAGAAVGWYTVKRRADYAWLARLWSKLWSRSPKIRTSYNPSISEEERADQIFRKIARHGLGSLTDSEKRFLDDYSRRKRGY
ncbi:MAG: hypothetical protein Kow00107_05470 [Planctomycetota bacterium]